MRPEQSMPRRVAPGGALGQRARTSIVLLLVGLFVLLLSVRGIANTVTDYLWFDAIGYDSVWRTEYLTRIVLAAIFTAIFFAFCWVNLWLADRMAPTYRQPSPEEEAVARFRELIGQRWQLFVLAVTALFALSIGASAQSQWTNWLLFTNSTSFGTTDAHFDRDISFYVFRLPFLSWLTNWLFTALIVIFVLTVAMHYLAGGIRLQSVDMRVTPQVKGHLSTLLALMALVRAFAYWLERYAMAYSTDGRFAGLSYTDVEARLPVLSLLILISLLSVVLFVVNMRRRGWGLPAVAVGLWALVSIVMGGIYPLVVQRFSVNPDETQKEQIYLARNIAATKNAYGLDGVEERVFDYAEEITGADLQTNADNISVVPLLEPGVTVDTFTLQQVERSYFRFATDANLRRGLAEVDVDRYEIDGVVTPVVIGARELNPDGLPDSGWETEVLSFTHGNGVALAPSNTVRGSLPVFSIGGLPAVNRVADQLPIEQPRLYYGENMSGYAIVDTDRKEVDLIDGSTRETHNYEGRGGVQAGGFLRRSMFALRFQSINPLIANFVRSDSRVVWNRNVRDRVQQVAPFLSFDFDAYPVILEGRIVYVLDGYTTTNNYPYAERANLSGLFPWSGLAKSHNYARNSVKAVVDSYDGTIDLYIVDATDPIAQTWSKAFPGVLQPFDDMPTELIDNLRYPEELFTVQTNMWSRYHITVEETDDLLEGSDEWAIAQDPGGVQGADTVNQTNADGTTGTSEARVDPYYTLLRLPEENDQEFVIFRSFVPFSNNDAVKEMQAFMAGVSEPGDDRYGRLVSYEVSSSSDNEAPGPALVASQIASQEEISERISLLNAQAEGSTVEFGDMVVVPVEDSLVYIRPLYVIATQTKQPNLEWIIASHADNVVMCHGLSDAINALFGVHITGAQRADADNAECIGDIQTSRNRAQSSASSSAGTPITIGDGDAVEQAADLLRQANDALGDGDLGRYQELVDTATTLLEDAISGS